MRRRAGVAGALPALLLAACSAGDRPVLGLWSGAARSEGQPTTRVTLDGPARGLLLRHRDSDLRLRLEGTAPAASVTIRVSDADRAPRPLGSETLPSEGGRFRHEIALSRAQLGDSSWIALALGQPGVRIDTLELHETRARSRLVVLGLDGLSWRILDPLLAAGRLPHFQRLIRSGVSGELISARPMLSPVVWTTIATGRPPADHGIHDFFDAERRLVNSTQVRARRVWEIAGEHAGASVGVVGWFVSWPVERVPGFMLADRATEWKPHERERPQSFHPPELQAPFDALVDERRRLYLAEMRRFTPLPLRADWKSALDPGDPLYARHAALDARLMRVYLRDSCFAEAALRLSAAFSPDLLFVYLRGSDNAQHAFWFHRAPDESLAPVEEDERRAFGGVIDGYYEWLDETLGRFMQAHPKHTTFAIVSDHGFRSIVREKGGVKRSAAYHERAGVYVMSGPGFKRGLRGPDISVLDLTPLWLHGLGLPAARDMPGRVPLELLEGGAAERARVASYGLRSQHAESRASGADEEIVEQLKALGYVE
jgi:hypothetical protein